MSQFIRSGYSAATVGKTVRDGQQGRAAGKQIDKRLYARLKTIMKSLLPGCIHWCRKFDKFSITPAEAMHILSDAGNHAGKAGALLRQALTKVGVTVPIKIDLELTKYTNNRGTKKLMFKPKHEIKDPYAEKMV